GIYSYLGNARYAIAYHNQFRTEMMKQSDYKLHYVLQEMLVKYETAKKELAIEQHKSEIKQYRTRLFIFIGGIIGAGILIVLLVSFLVIRSRRNRELAEMNTIKDKFFSIISHDLKNPAIAQNDALQLLAKNVETWDTPKLFNYARLLAASSNNLVDLIKDLLNWAQIQTGKKIYNPVTFNLVPKLQPDIETIKNMAAQKEIAFEAVMPQEAIITGDQNMLITVVRNLLSNAVKFTHSGGAVTLEIKAFGDKGIKGGGGYIVSVADTGTGISPKQLQNLFSIARQQSHEGTAGETGTGLGLIVCKEFLEKHGNQLHIESEEGKGSKVWFEI
ncbi:MAG: HAMP domain-containing histidine kinase, partial [Lentimicrobiaceae bacterium]|nr:HAMP domain-containing histidine kinase [Lentimicrobiaceae bacterium]